MDETQSEHGCAKFPIQGIHGLDYVYLLVMGTGFWQVTISIPVPVPIPKPAGIPIPVMIINRHSNNFVCWAWVQGCGI